MILVKACFCCFNDFFNSSSEFASFDFFTFFVLDGLPFFFSILMSRGSSKRKYFRKFLIQNLKGREKVSGRVSKSHKAYK